MKTLELRNDDDYRNLLKLLYLGFNVALTASEKPDEMDEFTKLKDYISSFRNDFDSKEFIVYSKKFNQYSASRKLYNELTSILDKYNRETMYDELSDALAERDIKKKYTGAELKRMTEMERIKIEGKIADKYWDEFVMTGVEKIKIGRK